jgi:sugar O-acyltransferase (sialic acid O-acetyltransferase NeuD family)
MMARKSLILIGGGGHCKSCIDVIEATGKYIIAGILDVKENIGKEIGGYKIIGTDDDIKELSSSGHSFLITVGQIKSAGIRMKIFTDIGAYGGKLETVISPAAIVSASAKIGNGTIVMHRATVGPNVVIGANNILNTGCILEHDTKTGDHCHISTHAVLNGNCQIGDGVFLGSQAVLVQNITIPNETVIGAGAVVVDSLMQIGTYVGNPAKRSSHD